MAKAPTPGIGKRKANNEAAKTVMRVRLKDESWLFNPTNLPFSVEKKVRKACDGRPFFWYMDEANFGGDTFRLMVWVARMVNGEPDLTIDDVDKQWPADFDLEDDFDVDEVPVDSPEVAESADPN